MNSKIWDKENNLIIEKIFNKLNSLGMDKSLNISKSEIGLLIDNKEIKNMLLFFVENVFSQDEITKLRKKINFYSLNKEKLESIVLLKEKKERLMNAIDEKKNDLLITKRRNREIIDKNISHRKELENKKKEDEKIIIESKILEISKMKIEQIKNDYSSFSLIENYKYFNKVNFTIINDTFTFEDFLEHNLQIFKNNFMKEDYKRIPSYSEEELNLLNLLNLPKYIKQIKQEMENLKILQVNDSFEEPILNAPEDLYNSILIEIKNHFQQYQLNLIDSYKKLNSNDKEALVKSNENLIKTFKISKSVVDYYKHLTLVKLNEELGSNIKHTKDYLEETNINIRNSFYNRIKNKEFEIDKCNTDQTLDLLKMTLKLLKKNKLRIDSFINKHFLPLSAVLEEKHYDLVNAFRNETIIFKNFNISKFTGKFDNNIYKFQTFDYEESNLNKLHLHNKIDVFNLFVSCLENSKTKSQIINSEREIKSSTYNNLYWKRFCLLFDKSSEMQHFLNITFRETISEFTTKFENINLNINLALNDLAKYKETIEIWCPEYFIKFLHERFPTLIK